MSKTTIRAMVDQVKRYSDYNITDTDLDTLIVDFINVALKSTYQLFMDYGIYQEISSIAQFKTIENQAYVDIQQARIIGNASTFTPVAGDKVDVTIDGTATLAIDIAACTTITLLAAAINAAVTKTVATVSASGYLVITSTTSGSTSSVAISNSAGTPCARLFYSSTDQSQSSISDLNEIIKLAERVNKLPIEIVHYSDFVDYYPDPAIIKSNTPYQAARWDNRIYFGPTPTGNNYIYMDYIVSMLDKTISDTLPFSNKYDSLIKSMSVAQLVKWQDRNNAVAIASANSEAKGFVDDLIINASKNFGEVRQSESRRGGVEYIQPRRPLA